MLEYDDFHSYHDNMLKLRYSRVDLVAFIEDTGKAVLGLPYVAHLIRESYPQITEIFQMSWIQLFQEKEVDFPNLRAIIDIAHRLAPYMEDDDKRRMRAIIPKCRKRMKDVDWIRHTVDMLNQELAPQSLRRFQQLKSMHEE